MTQSNALPEWLLVINGLITPLIAIALALVAFQQWRVASRKLALDLFDKRYSLYKRIIDGCYKCVTMKNEGAFVAEYNSMRLEATFLFGPEVHEVLVKSLDLIVDVAAFKPKSMEEAATQLDALLKRLLYFQDELTMAIASYLPYGQIKPSEFQTQNIGANLTPVVLKKIVLAIGQVRR